MAKSPDALVEPELLQWARESAHIAATEVARRLKVTEDRVLAWESGFERPSVAQLRQLADVYRRPVAVFFLPEPPRDFDALRDFRRLSGEDHLDISENLIAELRRAQELREAALTLLEDDDQESGFPISGTLASDAEKLAKSIRDLLNVSYEDQLAWKDAHTSLRAWRSAVEEVGVLVINMSGVEVAEARGFSVAHFPLPVVALNSRDSANGREFTLMHELAHLALHEGGICEWSRERRLRVEDQRVEAFCNSVAAAVLMPTNLVIEVIMRESIPSPDYWPDEIVRRHSRALCVSEEALLRRLATLGFVTEEFYALKRQEYLRRYAQAAASETTPVVRYEKRVIGSLGMAYLSLAFSAYYARRLSLSELSSYTGVRVKNLGKVEREAFGISRIPGASQ